MTISFSRKHYLELRPNNFDRILVKHNTYIHHKIEIIYNNIPIAYKMGFINQAIWNLVFCFTVTADIWPVFWFISVLIWNLNHSGFPQGPSVTAMIDRL